MEEEPILSILVTVYNHEKYIEECLKSILIQNTKYKYEVFIAEDCSKDNSRSILQRLEKIYPKNFHFIYRDRNYGMVENSRDLKTKVRSKYFIVLEGDDFWISEYKLQNQIDFLETHSDYVAIAHNTLVVDCESRPIKYKYPECKKSNYTWDMYEKLLLPGQTATMMQRTSILVVHNKYNQYDNNLYFPADRKNSFLLLSNGKIFCIQEKMSAYRLVMSGGDSYTATHINQDKDEYLKRETQFYKNNYIYALKEIKSLEAISATRNTYFFILFKNCFIHRSINKSIFYSELKKEKKYLNIILYHISKNIVFKGIEKLK